MIETLKNGKKKSGTKKIGTLIRHGLKLPGSTGTGTLKSMRTFENMILNFGMMDGLTLVGLNPLGLLRPHLQLWQETQEQALVLALCQLDMLKKAA